MPVTTRGSNNKTEIEADIAQDLTYDHFKHKLSIEERLAAQKEAKQDVKNHRLFYDDTQKIS